MKKTCICTGVTGQVGSYLAELLLEKDYKVYGLKRRNSTNNLERIKYIINDVEIIEGDILDSGTIYNAVQTIKPNEFYNLAAQSHVGFSFKNPQYTFDSNATSVVTMLEAIRLFSPGTHFYQASTSELFGNCNLSPQNENTPFSPESPYAVAKLAAHKMVEVYRKSYNLFACSGICFNHTGPRRGEDFVTQKIAKAVAKISCGKQDKIELGNIEAKRDWGYAKDYVKAMWMMLQNEVPKDYVIATGETHSVKEFLELAFKCVGLNYKDYLKINPEFCRPNDVQSLCGDWSKILRELGWKPETSFQELVKLMVNSALIQERVND